MMRSLYNSCSLVLPLLCVAAVAVRACTLQEAVIVDNADATQIGVWDLKTGRPKAYNGDFLVTVSEDNLDLATVMYDPTLPDAGQTYFFAHAPIFDLLQKLSAKNSKEYCFYVYTFASLTYIHGQNLVTDLYYVGKQANMRYLYLTSSPQRDQAVSK